MPKKQGKDGIILETKKVSWRHLSLGQEVCGWSSGNMNHGAQATVLAVNAATVTLNVFGTREEQVSSEETMFEVELTDEEFHQKYQSGAEAVIKGIQNKLSRGSIGHHVLWNAWLTYDPYEMAAACKREGMKVIGHCTDITPKHTVLGLVEDIGICAEYEDGEKIWCHGGMRNLDQMLQSWDRRIGRMAAERGDV